MNNCNFIGRLTKDPEVKSIGEAGKVANFTIAVRRKGKGKEGEPDADFLRMVAFNKVAELIEAYFHKGKEIGVSSRCRHRSYEKDGVTQYITEFVIDDITFIGSKEDNGNSEKKTEARPVAKPQASPKKSNKPAYEEDDSDVPF